MCVCAPSPPWAVRVKTNKIIRKFLSSGEKFILELENIFGNIFETVLETFCPNKYVSDFEKFKEKLPSKEKF